jgi:tellurite resistance protein TerC
MTDSLWLWIAFNAFVLVMLALDLGVFHRKTHTIGLRESLAWTAVWVVLALGFNLWVWLSAGSEKGLEFFTGYLIEKSLSVDNVFVFALLFTQFSVPVQYQHKVLFWGILGALVMRAVMIVAGAAILHHAAWVIYVFGAFLILTGVNMVRNRPQPIGRAHGILSRRFAALIPVTDGYRGDRFLVHEDGVRKATPLFVVLVLVEFVDLIFAVDSIPAVFAVTQDPFIVYTSNVFALLGLRSLYFALAGVMHRFRHLKTGLGVVLVFVGIKMLLAHTPWKIDTLISLTVIAVILTASVVWSLLGSGAARVPSPAPPDPRCPIS